MRMRFLIPFLIRHMGLRTLVILASGWHVVQARRVYNWAVPHQLQCPRSQLFIFSCSSWPGPGHLLGGGASVPPKAVCQATSHVVL